MNRDTDFEVTWGRYVKALEDWRHAQRDMAATRNAAAPRNPNRLNTPRSLSEATLKAGAL